MATLGLVDTLSARGSVREAEGEWKERRIQPDCVYDALTGGAFYEAASL